MNTSSIAVILSTTGAPLDLAALQSMPHARVVRAEFARGELAACVAATIEHDCSAQDLLNALKPWASNRGWQVTVAPLARTC